LGKNGKARVKEYQNLWAASNEWKNASNGLDDTKGIVLNTEVQPLLSLKSK